MSDPEAPGGQQPSEDAAQTEVGASAPAEGVVAAAEVAESAAPAEVAGSAAPAEVAESAAPAEGAESAAPADEAPRISEGEVAAPVAAVAESAEEAPRHRHPFYLRGRRLRPPKSRGGLLALVLVLAAVGFVGVFASVSMIQWTESADFCGRCHTMAPELQAYHEGPHRDVSCGECHVEPGIQGWLKAKMNGTRQLIDVVLGTFPTPIPPPDHADLPKAQDTCMKCHTLDQRQFVQLKTKTSFFQDEANSREFVGLMIRPVGGDTFDVNRSVHWHVLEKVEFSAGEVNAPIIDYVKSSRDDGSIHEYIAQRAISDATNVQPDIDKITAEEPLTTMTCYDCHNRIGHDVGSPRIGLDYGMYAGMVDNTLPYLKREGMRLLHQGYPDEPTADAEIEKLADFYKTNYPDVYKAKLAQINEAIIALKGFYRKTATPAMKVTPTTYPNSLGHLDGPGCFRCHDGGHFKVVDGVATKETIPSTCDTCHTFPQIGPAVASLPLGEPPSTHDDQMWVFSHKAVATSVDPGGQTCGECHARDYCVNCHSTGALTINHDQMATNHAQIIRDQGNNSCAYCHQEVFCARCHKEPVLPVTSPFSQEGTGAVPGPVTGSLPGSLTGSLPADQRSGVLWPLKPPS